LASKCTAENRLIAVVDIGSNSVRLVVYRGLKRSPDNIFNERVLCGLAAGVTATGRMAEDSMAQALAALRRFAHLCRDMQVDQVIAVATAAVRDSANGQAFVQQVRRECGFKVRVLPGLEEAELSAYGVLSGFPGASGVMGDLGGGSLELARIEDGRVSQRVSLPIGPLRLLQGNKSYGPGQVRQISAALAEVEWLQRSPGCEFFMVGGSWRALAHIHILDSDWPLHVLHGYRLGGNKAVRFSNRIAERSVDSLKAAPGVASRRALMLPLSAKILGTVLQIIKAPVVHTSACGLRDGLLYQALPPRVRVDDPLLAHVREFSRRTARFEDHGRLLSKWMDPVFADESENDRRLRRAACHCSDISWNAHPDFKADLAFTRTLVMRYVGVTHPERVQIALSLFIAYGGSLKAKSLKKVLKICRPHEIERAVTHGLAIALGLRLTGGTGEPLKRTALLLQEGRLVLAIPAEGEDLAGGLVMKRLESLAAQLGRAAEIKITS
jgi:exopolyphosphatase/guanosine-5'-triphosphate,3'-diphosphate pyrophosphatase